MSTLLVVWLFAWLACHLGAHIALIGGLFSRRSITRGILSMIVPPLAPYWGWEMGMQKRALVWVFAVAAYAVGIAFAPS